MIYLYLCLDLCDVSLVDLLLQFTATQGSAFSLFMVSSVGVLLVRFFSWQNQVFYLCWSKTWIFLSESPIPTVDIGVRSRKTVDYLAYKTTIFYGRQTNRPFSYRPVTYSAPPIISRKPVLEEEKVLPSLWKSVSVS